MQNVYWYIEVFSFPMQLPPHDFNETLQNERAHWYKNYLVSVFLSSLKIEK